MIKISNGNIFTCGAEAIVNAVNCEGIMGGGLALAFKTTYPLMYEIYRQRCVGNWVQPGFMDIHWIEKPINNTKIIINFPTKQLIKNPSQLVYIEEGMKSLTEAVKEHTIASVGIPALGCGLGGLSWEKVYPVIEKHVLPIDNVEWIVFEPK